MENETDNKMSFFSAIENFAKKNKRKILIIFILIISCLLAVIFFNYYQENQNKKISEQYIKAGIYLTQNKREKSKDIYKDIIYKKNKFYSYLSLNNIIENKMIKNNDEILELFEVLENIDKDREQQNLVKLKKALFLMEISKKDEAMLIFDSIISSNSIWKEIAMQFSRTK